MASLLPPLATAAACQPPGSLNDSADVLSKGAQKAAAARIDKFFEAADPVWIGCNTLWVFVWVLAPAIVALPRARGNLVRTPRHGVGDPRVHPLDVLAGASRAVSGWTRRAPFAHDSDGRVTARRYPGGGPSLAPVAGPHPPARRGDGALPARRERAAGAIAVLRAGPSRRGPQAVSGGERPVVRRRRPSRRGRGRRNGVLPALPRAVRPLGRDVLGLFGGSAGKVGASGRPPQLSMPNAECLVPSP